MADALAAQQAAEAARDAAATSAHIAQTAATSAEAALKKAEESEKKATSAAEEPNKEARRQTRVAILNFAVNVLLFGAIFGQAILSRESGMRADNQMRTGLIQQEKADRERLIVALKDSQPFQHLHALDPGCAKPPPLPPSEEISVNILTEQVLAHSEHYYFMALALDLPSEWESICNRLKRTTDRYCHLKERLVPLLQGSTQDFTEAFEKCKLPGTSDS